MGTERAAIRLKSAPFDCDSKVASAPRWANPREAPQRKGLGAHPASSLAWRMTRWPAPPRLAASFYKAHGLGNDYLVFEEPPGGGGGKHDWEATPAAIQAVCDPHRGVGSDGIVALLADLSAGRFRLRMFNPDGSEFERSGNGLRVLASYLRGSRLVGEGDDAAFPVVVGGSRVNMTVHTSARGLYDISVEMGRASVGPAAVELDPK